MDPDQTAQRSSLTWVHTVCIQVYIKLLFVSKFAVDDISRSRFQLIFPMTVKVLNHGSFVYLKKSAGRVYSINIGMKGLNTSVCKMTLVTLTKTVLRTFSKSDIE